MVLYIGGGGACQGCYVKSNINITLIFEQERVSGTGGPYNGEGIRRLEQLVRLLLSTSARWVLFFMPGSVSLRDDFPTPLERP